jgi:hypothetical protein
VSHFANWSMIIAARCSLGERSVCSARLDEHTHGQGVVRAMHSGSAGPGGSSAGGAAAPPALQRRGYSAGARHALPKGRLAPGGGAWIEARQGTGVTLVRNACLMSPAGVKKSYANYTVVNGIGPHAAAGLESTWVRSRGSDRRAGGGGMELDAELVESDDQDASADETRC